MRPYIQISVGGTDITSVLSQVAMSVTITDTSGSDADNLQLEIADPNGVISPPKKGVTITVIAGYADRKRDFGQFVVDQVTYNGYPQTISISAQSADARSEQKQKREKSYGKDEYPTYGDLFSELANRAGLQLSIANDLASKENEYEAQSEEDDIEFASRIARGLDAGVTIKSGRMVVAKRGDGQTISGQPSQTIIISEGLNILSYSVTGVDKPLHSSVEARWFDRKKVEHKLIVQSANDIGPTLQIRQPFQSEEEATRFAEARARELNRASGNANFEINGDPFVYAEARAIAQGIRPGVDGLWVVKSVTHTWSGSDIYRTSLDCEPPSTGKEGAQGTAPSGPASSQSGPTDAPAPNRSAEGIQVPSVDRSTAEGAWDSSKYNNVVGDGPE